ncbi:sarcoplasmic calcium-binding protein 1 isoform X1 [Bombyx mandarina]|uniref:Sarcoplasmic calcium-binding protein 1 n=2 Tax=Bombyx TaxID=7090 RepID=A0A8R2M4W9_BOMMO|nr:sarcoplasmic calcium-binding protein 1 isoform X1 [Bombyx mandarina]XP_037874353.1 sarcoplasmic calcium-binding protein 1 isoform X1 [Bombyx mori]
MAYSWDNRVAFVVKYLYDIDNNGYLDAHDFHCLALRTCVLEGKGDCSSARLQKYQHVMLNLWEEIAQLADFDKVPDYDGIVTVDEFKQAVMNSCVGRRYEDFPQSMRAFIETNFRMIDINCDGVLALEEYRYDCVQRMVVEDIKVVDEAYSTLLNDDDRRRGGLTLSRYQELFAQFLGDVSDDCEAKHLFGPLEF